MSRKPLSEGQIVRIRPQVKEHGGKVGTVVSEGEELGWRVVKVRFDGPPRSVTVAFSPNEVEPSWDLKPAGPAPSKTGIRMA